MPVDIKQALDLKLNAGLNYHQIASIQKVDHTAVLRKLKPLLPNDCTEVFKNNRADILAHGQLRLLSSVTEAKLKRLNPRDAVVSFGILYDKERLERGLSTERIDHVCLSAKLSDLQAERSRLESMIQAKHQRIIPTQTSQSIDNT